MEKLIKKFEIIHSRDTEEVHNIKCAELAADIAVEYLKWFKFKYEAKLFSENKSYNVMDISYKFNEFLEQYERNNS